MTDAGRCRKLLEQAVNDLNLEKDRTRQLQYLIDYDSETGLLCRHVLMRRLNQMVNHKREKFAYGIIQLDQAYKRIRHSRDRMKVLLYVTAERVKSVIGEENLYQSDRMDEFLFVLPLNKDAEEIAGIVNEVMEQVRGVHNPPASDISFGCNIGVTIFPDHGETVQELEDNAEIALTINQKEPWGEFMYSPEVGAAYHENNSLEFILRNIILRGFNGFHVAYQPLVDADRNIIGCEALMRWDVPGQGAVPPSRFIPLAEKGGPIVYLGKWILYKVLAQLKVWRKIMDPDFFVSINMSLVQLEQPDCVEMIETAMKLHNLPGSALQIEVTESTVMKNPELVCSHLESFQKMGIRIMLDDFGTGYSSLAILNTLPVNTLKIAKEIIDNFPEDPRSVEIVRAIMALSSTFGFTALAEGVEKENQYIQLREYGCDVLQGFLFSEPVTAQSFQEQFLQASI